MVNKPPSNEVKTTGLAGGLHWPYKGLIQPRLKTHERFANRNLIGSMSIVGVETKRIYLGCAGEKRSDMTFTYDRIGFFF